MATILIPIPSTDFDPTESAVPWLALSTAGHLVTFATPDGAPGNADPIMVAGKGLGLLAPLLMADANGRNAYAAMTRSAEFQSPLRYADVRPTAFDALLLPGGHAPGMKPYLESIIFAGANCAILCKQQTGGSHLPRCFAGSAVAQFY